MQFSRNAGKYHTGIGMFLCACATFPAGANRHESEICPPWGPTATSRV